MQDNNENHQAKVETIVTPSVTAPPVKVKARRKTGRRVVAVVTSTLLVIALAFGAGLAGAWVYGKFFSEPAVSYIIEDQSIDGNTLSTAEEQSIASVAELVGKSVVSIVTETRSSFYSSQSGAGTGIIVSKDGYIMTNKHVVSGATDVSVILSDGTQYDDVKITGLDPLNDIAFIKVADVDNLPAVAIGDSSTVRIGQQVVAIGNALGRYQNTVTTGIISGMGRPIVASSGSGGYESLTDLLQTDAAINSGNSGGPLVNLAGQVIGINTAVAVDANSIGFAIPINSTKGLLKGVLETGRVERAFLGVSYVAVTPSLAKENNLSVQAGAYVSGSGGAVVGDGPADKAGLKRGDVIVKIDDHAITETANLASVLGLYRPGDEITIEYIRDGDRSTVKVALEMYKD